MESCLDFIGNNFVIQPHPTRRKAGEDVYLNTLHEGGENGFGWTTGSLHCTLGLSNFTARHTLATLLHL